MMSTSKKSNRWTISVLLSVILVSNVIGEKAPKTTAFSEISNDYERIMLPSGRYQPETYVVAEGEKFDKTGNDDSLDALDFAGVANILSNALYEADYIPTPNPEETDLLILIHWGKTQPTFTDGTNHAIDRIGSAMNSMSQLTYLTDAHHVEKTTLGAFLESDFESKLDAAMVEQRMFQSIRNEKNAYNARLLGYVSELNRSEIMGDTIMTMQHNRDSLMSEIESPRYFVILQAYDFQKIRNEKVKKMLWSTRFSIRAKGRKFNEDLYAMAMASSRVIGTESSNLERGLTPARVEFGELEYLGIDSKE